MYHILLFLHLHWNLVCRVTIHGTIPELHRCRCAIGADKLRHQCVPTVPIRLKLDRIDSLVRRTRQNQIGCRSVAAHVSLWGDGLLKRILSSSHLATMGYLCPIIHLVVLFLDADNVSDRQASTRHGCLSCRAHYGAFRAQTLTQFLILATLLRPFPL